MVSFDIIRDVPAIAITYIYCDGRANAIQRDVIGSNSEPANPQRLRMRAT